jgi:Phage T4 tail fibre
MKNNFFTSIIFCLVFTFCIRVNAQIHSDQNGLKSSVISNLSANDLQAMRYEVATLGFNSHHWQPGGIIIVELFQQSFSTGYQRYVINNGFGVGINFGETKLNLVESEGQEQHAKVTLGIPYNLATSYGGYINKALPIYIDVKYYTRYKVKITYQQERVDNLDYINQIKINTAPVPTAIDDFSVPFLSDNPLTSTSNLMVTGEGTHYISKGNVGIGTINPTAKLQVLGGDIAVSGNLLVSTGNATGGGIKLADDGDIVDLNDGWATHRFSSGIRITNANGGGNPVIQLANNNNIPSYFNAGNVGIGTITPTEKLTVNGKIKAREIRIDAQDMPDYVFEDNYHKLSLSEIEQYVKVNKHLPDVPSANAFERDGMAVGEMNKLLLKKIEELTLHLIEKDKTLSIQQKDVITLKQNAEIHQQMLIALKKQVKHLLSTPRKRKL